jgi:hypothetical protein
MTQVMDRSSQPARGGKNAANCYRLLHNEKKKARFQLSLDSFSAERSSLAFFRKRSTF